MINSMVVFGFVILFVIFVGFVKLYFEYFIIVGY